MIQKILNNKGGMYMPVLKAKINGVWQDVAGMSTGSDADTLDGKHADEFATSSEVENLKGLVGNTPVSDQIDAAIAGITTPDVENQVFVVEIDKDTMTASHSSSEIQVAYNEGKYIVAYYGARSYIHHLTAFGQTWLVSSADHGYSYSLFIDEDKNVEESWSRPCIEEITATPGQMAVVKTVNDNGQPIESEAVDFVDSADKSVVTAIAMEQVDDTVTITYTMDDDSTSVDTITLDVNGYPTNINVDGTDIPITLSGFDEEVTIDG
jgi:hypothetical protein